MTTRPSSLRRRQAVVLTCSALLRSGSPNSPHVVAGSHSPDRFSMLFGTPELRYVRGWKTG
jgi:hypothetical protein